MPIVDLGLLNRKFIVRVPIGTIVIWSGTSDDIPNGWHLCDGEDGTPDLSDKFVSEANNSYKFCYIMKLAFDDTDKGSDIYSEEETVVGTWIDGKPLYRKVIQTTTPAKDVSGTVATLPDGTDKVIHLDGFIVASNNIRIPIIYNGTNPKTTESSNGFLIMLTTIDYAKKTISQLAKNEGYANRPSTLILEYTKTTD